MKIPWERRLQMKPFPSPLLDSQLEYFAAAAFS
jgi:hypothetical protein